MRQKHGENDEGDRGGAVRDRIRFLKLGQASHSTEEEIKRERVGGGGGARRKFKRLMCLHSRN